MVKKKGGDHKARAAKQQKLEFLTLAQLIGRIVPGKRPDAPGIFRPDLFLLTKVLFISVQALYIHR
ncbi:hypothetical protein SDC9_113580 [bioreactor metagenome]|uniref:Uncharacterized protein n=1 Tax=bioreactor metagenome TaxID=1076179 RepID=A0A645BMG2_9ZZZZ